MAKCTEAIIFSMRIDLVIEAVEQVDDEFVDYVLHGVTEEIYYNAHITCMSKTCL